MPNNEFVKGTCEYCDGHLEFMPDAIGQSITCPHCGKLILLKADERRKKSGVWAGILVGIIMIVCLAGAGLAGWYFWGQKASSAPETEKSPAPTTNLTAKMHTPVPAPEPKPVATTNDFAVLPYKLEKTAGSSLVYVTGAIRNLTDRQRFGVKIEFGLFDTNDQPAGSATDYESVMEPHAVWSFHALALGSKTASVQLNSIAEDK